MSDLEAALGDYLRLRRSLGHELADPARLLPRFVADLDARGARTVTIDAALTWCQQQPAARVSNVGPARMTAVRGFARYLAGIDPDTQVPPLRLMPHRARWRPPFIYSPADIDLLMATARRVIDSPLRAATYTTVIGLLAVSGLRIGEALKLDCADIDWAEGVLLIRESKFGKSRLVPLHPSSMAVLAGYARLRDELQPHPKDPSFFVSRTRKRLLYAVVGQVLRELVDQAGIGLGAPSPPRGCTTCATPSRSPPCSAGTEPVKTCRPNSRPCRPTWVTVNRPRPTGTSRPPPSCWPWRRHVGTGPGRRPGRGAGHDPGRADPAGLLHRPAHPASPSQPPHHRGLP